MENQSVYVQKLSEYLVLPISLMVIVCIMILVLTFICIRIKYRNMAFLNVVGGLLILLTMYIFCVQPYQRDINENAFITYTGSFYVEECYSVNRGGTYILIKYENDQSSIRYKVLCDTSTIQNETLYFGSIIYSEHSKCLVGINLSDDSPAK